MRVKVPKDVFADARKLSRAVENGLEGAAKGAKADFGVTTQTWEHEVPFDIERSPGRRVVSTTDEIYSYVNDGTPAHPIVAHGPGGLAFGVPSRPKTMPRVIGSTGGSRGSTIVHVRRVQHPGSEGRHFDEVIAEKWEKELPTIMQRAIDSEV